MKMKKTFLINITVFSLLSLSLTGCKKEYPATYIFTETPQIVSDYQGSVNTEEKKGIYFKFGDFPQTIKDESVKISSTVCENGYYTGDDGNYYAKVEENGNAVNVNYSNGLPVQVKQNPPRILYFKVEPIIWRLVCDDYGKTSGQYNDGKCLLLCESIIDSSVPFYDDENDIRTINGKEVYPSNYEFSQVRAYLNGTEYPVNSSIETKWVDKGFLQKAFTEDAQKLIEVTFVDNSLLHMSYNGKDRATASLVCSDTYDKVFLLSELEAVEEGGLGFPTFEKVGNASTRVRFPTDYSLAKYAYKTENKNCGGKWWLRSPYYDGKSYARDIQESGFARKSNHSDSELEGIVPAITIKRENLNDY